MSRIFAISLVLMFFCTSAFGYDFCGVSVGTDVYAYEVSVPWILIGVNNSGYYQFSSSWQPDCENDLIAVNFSDTRNAVPEPSGLAAILVGLVGIAGYSKKRRRQTIWIKK